MNTADVENFVGKIANVTNIPRDYLENTTESFYTATKISQIEDLYGRRSYFSREEEDNATKKLFKEFIEWAKKNNKKLDFSGMEEFLGE